METRINSQKVLSNEIKRILSTLETISKGDCTFTNIQAKIENCEVWERLLILSSQVKKKFYYILPITSDISFPKILKHPFFQKFNSQDIFFINVFNISAPKTNVISKEDFYKILLNLDGYINFFNEDSTVSRINKLYVDRTISIISDEEEFDGNSASVQVMLSHWARGEGKRGLPILLLGDRGIGKSWVAKRFCLNQLKLFSKNPWLNLPALYINLSVLADRISQQSNIWDALLFHIKDLYDIRMLNDYYVFETFIRLGKIILVFDGFDEMSKEMNEEIMNKNLWEIFSIVNKTAKVVMTSRINHFDSQMRIFKHFSYLNYIKLKNKTSVIENGIEYSEVGTRIRKNFNIWELNRFQIEDYQNLFTKYIHLKDKRTEKAIKLLKSFKEKSKEWNIEYELNEIMSIPAIYDALIKVIGNTSMNLLSVYKYVLYSAIIEYNIDSNRAIQTFMVIVGESLKRWDLGAQKKIEILSEIAWYMFERNYNYFMFERLPEYLTEKYKLNFQISINDIRSQTVIILSEEKENGYKFFTDGIYAFLVSTSIYLNLCSEDINENIVGMESLGRYDFTSSQIGKRALNFLREEIQNTNKLESRLKLQIVKKIKDGPPYSVWSRFLLKNCELLGISFEELKSKYPWATTSFQSENEKLVLVARNKNIGDSFFIGVNEVTNKEFEEFLNDIPEPNTDEENFASIDKISIAHPGFYWKRDGKWRVNLDKRYMNPLNSVMNDYHLMLWTDGKVPENKKDHPVVYISWFAAAYYCNWLSQKHGLPIFYHFSFEKQEKQKNIDKREETKKQEMARVVVKKDTNSYGYRLPRASEWKYVAQEGDDTLSYPWDKFRINGELSPEGEDYMKKLLREQPETYPVRNEKQDKFGVTGLVGNVREWVDRSKKGYEEEFNIIRSQQDPGFIKGATWLLGREGFEFNYLNGVFAENTNFDVGFRIARSLSAKEKILLESAFLQNTIKED